MDQEATYECKKCKKMFILKGSDDKKCTHCNCKEIKCIDIAF